VLNFIVAGFHFIMKSR